MPSMIIQRMVLFAVPAAMLGTIRCTLEGTHINICARGAPFWFVKLIPDTICRHEMSLIPF